MTDWIQIPGPPLLVSKAVPYLVDQAGIDEVRGYFAEHGAHRVEIDITAAGGVVDVIGAMKEVLPFPDWCGSSWDSIADAFQEIRELWTFPLLVIVHGLPAQLDRNPHLGLEVGIRFDGLQESFSLSADQVVFVYAAERWPR